MSDEFHTFQKGLSIELACEAVTWGIFMPLAAFSVYALLEQGLYGSRPRQGMLAAISVMFVCSSAGTLIDLHFQESVYSRVSGPGSIGFVIETTWVSWTWRLLKYVNLVISDLIVVWRCWALWKRHRWATFILYIGVLILFVFFAFNVISGFVLQIVTGNSAFPGLDCAKGLLMVVPYPFINVIATALMGYRAWYHHKDSRNLSSMECNGRSLDIRRIVLFMTESGLLYCLYWITELIRQIMIYISAFALPNETPNRILDTAFGNVSAIYPTLVIVLVLFDKTMEHDMCLSDSPGLVLPMQFAPRPVVERSGGLSMDSGSRGMAVYLPALAEHGTNEDASESLSYRKRDAES